MEGVRLVSEAGRQGELPAAELSQAKAGGHELPAGVMDG